jgi:hypothetical protein
MALAIAVCEDCFYVYANGTMPEDRAPGTREPWQLWEGLDEFAISDSGSSYFSHGNCDACGCTYSGMRYGMSIVRLRKSQPLTEKARAALKRICDGDNDARNYSRQMIDRLSARRLIDFDPSTGWVATAAGRNALSA